MFSSHANNVFGDTDFVELLNISGATVPTAGWTLTDSPLHLGPDFNDLEVLIQAASIGPDVRLVQWIGLTTMGSAEAGTLEYGMNAPGPDNGLLRRNDDLFLYDANDQLVAYMGWGDKNAPTSQISVRPPMQTWGLWDPTFELQMRHSGRDSVSATPDGLNSTLSGCWERTGSGDAQLPGRCANPVATIDTDTDPNRRNSAGRDNTVAAPYTGTNLVISEYAVDGMAGGNADNFIEIFNPTPVAVDLSTVSLEIHRNGALQETVDLDFQAGTPAPAILNPGQALLLGEQGPGIFANPGVNSDLTFATKLNSWNYSFRIIDAAGSILDTVGSQSSTLFEGTGVAESYDDNSFPRSFQRRSSFRPAGCVDTDDNSLDITLGNTISPTRITAPLTPCTPHTYITDGSRTLTISEVQVNAWNDPDGFIELFNPSNPNVPVNLAGWQIYIGGSLSATLPAVTLAPGDHYLVGGTAYSGPAADFIMSDDVESTELLELRDPGGNPVVSIQFASQLLANLTNNSSYERGFGGCAHDGNPAVDFEWTSAPSPTVQGASIQPCS